MPCVPAPTPRDHNRPIVQPVHVDDEGADRMWPIMRKPALVLSKGNCFPTASSADCTAPRFWANFSAGRLLPRGKAAIAGTSIHSRLMSGNGPKAKLSTKAWGALSEGSAMAFSSATPMNLAMTCRMQRSSFANIEKTAFHLLFDSNDAEYERRAARRSLLSSSERDLFIRQVCA